jgi:RNA polymerase sigma-70 factor (ECF subfamily)
VDAFPATLDEGATRELVRRIQDGHEDAWEELYRAYRDELLFYVRARLGSRLRSVLESEDVLQSVALEAFRALPRFEHRGEGSLRRFLRALVLNKLRDRADTFNAAKRSGGVALDGEAAERLAAPDVEPVYADPVYDRLERALAELPDEMREVVLLRRVEERPSAEVAERMNKSDEAVRKLYSRALARLALRLGDGER